MSWLTLYSQLTGVNKHSTSLGKVWLSVLLFFRIMILMLAAEKVWGDEKSEFSCNTLSPGCESVCYDHYFPISHIRLWCLQLIFVSTPALLVAMYVAYNKHGTKRVILRSGNENIEGDLKALKNKRLPITGQLWWIYFFSLLLRLLFEGGFMYALYTIYGSFYISRAVLCNVKPCENQANCYISRPTEKTIFTIFMVVSSSLCILLNLAELFYLIAKALIRSFQLSNRRQDCNHLASKFEEAIPMEKQTSPKY
uniref:Gap junction protein n=1 Tax=Paramormyrops kingsleyae TaxID=1676925 RepID=A0A3B3RBB6_9TELE|nr:gap junction beta-2 protein-like [Paramormyrops kingsleyae]